MVPSSRAMNRPIFACLSVCVLIPTTAHAFEVSGGVSVGGILIGTDPRFAVSPHAGISWGLGSSVDLAVHDQLNILPAVNRLGVGIYNQLSVTVGYAWNAGSVSIGPSLSLYSTPACGVSLCGRVVGVGPGGHAEVNVFFAGPLGASVSANLDWVGGASLALPGGIAAMVTVGPVLRWRAN